MCRYLDTSIYSLDGNSIFEVALKFERLGLQEISKTPQTIFQGQDLNNSQVAFNYKMQFDKLFTLIKEFYVKVNGTQSMYDSINEDMDDEIMKVVINARRTKTVKLAKNTFIKKIRENLGGYNFGEIIEKLKTKMPRILNAKDDVVLKYAKFEMIIDALNETFKILEDNDGNSDLIDALTSFEDENQETLMDVLKTIEDTYIENSDEVKNEIILGLKKKTELRNRLYIRSTLRLSRYKGSVSNVLRDILLTSSSMNQDITSKRIILLESLKQDERLVRTIVDDNKLISEYMKELFNMEEIGKNYIEPFIKVVENMKKNNQFVTELKNIDTVVD